MQLLAEVSGRQPGQAREAGSGNALAVRAMATQASHGGGVGEHFPPLAGQPASYLVAQLNAWRDGTRSNDPNQLMVGVAKAMTDDEIKAVAEFFARPASQEVKP